MNLAFLHFAVRLCRCYLGQAAIALILLCQATPTVMAEVNIQLYGSFPALSITGVEGSNYAVQTVTSLSQTNNWQTLMNLTLPSSPYFWVDTTNATSAQRFYRVEMLSNTNNYSNPPSGMALIPGGLFTMGDSLDGEADAPTNTVYVSAFYMETNLVSFTFWLQVYPWATNHGYNFDDPFGISFPDVVNLPEQGENWYDAVKWCNARSQMAGLSPVYYTDAKFTHIYTNGDVDTVYANWTAVGYRLPTEAEWEKAARGGLNGQRFPWGDTISESQANYYGDPIDYSYDLGPAGLNPADDTLHYGYTCPVGSFAPNGYGLYDMAGNADQWCWDWYGAYGTGAQIDPRGATSGVYRVSRGGDGIEDASECRTAYRRFDLYPYDDYSPRSLDLAFRSVLAPALPAYTITLSASASAGGTVSGGGTFIQGSLQTVTATVTYGCVFIGWSGDASGTNNPLTITVNTNLNITANFSPTGATLIPAGTFTMGDDLDGESDAIPTVAVNISAFYMDVNLVSYSQWQSIYNWATTNGYSFEDAGSGKAADHPVQSVDWYDAVIWCNARSEQAGLTPVYYTDAGLTQVLRRLAVPNANWLANGYRLPTEAEWEKAARGGLNGQRFPWGNDISESLDNYYSDMDYSYDLGPIGYNVAFSTGAEPYTSPVGYFAPNGYGLYDMAGNVYEWCWDWYATPYAGGSDPRGPSSSAGLPFGGLRVLRSDAWDNDAYGARCANRGADFPLNTAYDFGFRCVRGQ